MTPSSDSRPVITAVICTRNSGQGVLDTMIGLRHQSMDFDSYEVLVVDNASDDGSSPWLSRQSEAFGFRYVEEPELGLSAAKNRAIAESRADLIYFIDDDAVPPAHLLQAVVEDFESEDADIVGGPVHGLWAKTPPYWLRIRFWRALSLVSWGSERRPLKYPEIVLGGNSAYRRAVFEKYGTFNQALGRKGESLLGNEERELERRIMDDGGKVFYDPRVYIFHLVPENRLEMSYFAKRSQDGAYSILTMKELIGEKDEQQVVLERLNREPVWKKRLRYLYDTVRYRPIGALKARARILFQAIKHGYGYYRFEMKLRRSSTEGRRNFFRDRGIMG